MKKIEKVWLFLKVVRVVDVEQWSCLLWKNTKLLLFHSDWERNMECNSCWYLRNIVYILIRASIILKMSGLVWSRSLYQKKGSQNHLVKCLSCGGAFKMKKVKLASKVYWKEENEFQEGRVTMHAFVERQKKKKMNGVEKTQKPLLKICTWNFRLLRCGQQRSGQNRRMGSTSILPARESFLPFSKKKRERR